MAAPGNRSRMALGASLLLASLAGCAMPSNLLHPLATEAAGKAAASAVTAGAPAPAYFSSIVWMVDENHGYSQVAKLQNTQYLATHGAVLAQSFAMAHPSGPNYRLIAGGQTFSSQEVFQGQEPSVATEYESLGFPTMDWYVAGTPDLKHDPYQELQGPTPITPRTDAFDPDSLPADCQVYLGFDDADNAHSGSLAAADQNVMAVLHALDQSEWFHTPDASGKYPVFMETWDESYLGDQHIFTAFYGDGVKPGYASQVTYNHLSVCRTMTDNWGLPPLGDAAQAQPIADIWK